MPVQTFNPNDVVSTGNWAVAQRLVGAFAPHAQGTPDMTVALDKGWLLNGTTLTEVNPQTVGPFAAPANRRVDRIVVDRTTGVASIVAGTEGSLVPPAIPAGTLPVVRVVLDGATVEIANALLFDERALSDLASSGSLNPTLTALGALDATPGLVEQTGAAAFVKHALGAATAASVPTRADADGRYLQLAGGTLGGTLTLSGAPAAPLQAATKGYVDATVQAAVAELDGETAPVSDPTFGTKATAPYFVSTVATGTAPLTVASTTVVSNLNADLLDGQHGSYYAPLANLASYVPLAGGVTLQSPITLSGDPVSALHPATKQYVDNTLAGWFAKQPVKVATTGNIALAGAQSIDGVAAVAGDRVLVKNQTAPAENGVYVVASGSWSRATDFDLWAEVPGAFVFVNQGSTNGDRAWGCTADAGGTLGSTAIGFTQFMGTGAYQVSSAELTGLSALSSAGMVARTSAGTYAARTVAAAGSDIIAITNGDGVAGSPIIGTSMATGKLLGRSTAGTGAVEPITLGAGLTMTAGVLNVVVASETVAGVAEIATQAETNTGTDDARVVTPLKLEARLTGAAVRQGKHSIWIPAAAMTPRTTNGAATGTVETATNKVMRKTLDFDTATSEYAQFSIAMPKMWDEGTVTFRAVWTAASGSGGVAWGLQGVALSDDDAFDTAFGTAVLATDTLITAADVHTTSESSAITIAGTPAAEDLAVFQVYRAVADAADTLGVDAQLVGVRLYFTVNAATDA